MGMIAIVNGRLCGDPAATAAAAARALELADALEMPRVRARALHDGPLLHAAVDPATALSRYEALPHAVEHDLRALWPDAIGPKAAPAAPPLAAPPGTARCRRPTPTQAAQAAPARHRRRDPPRRSTCPREPAAAADRDALAERLEGRAQRRRGSPRQRDPPRRSRRPTRVAPSAAGARRESRPLGGWGSPTPTQARGRAARGARAPRPRRAGIARAAARSRRTCRPSTRSSASPTPPSWRRSPPRSPTPSRRRRSPVGRRYRAPPPAAPAAPRLRQQQPALDRRQQLDRDAPRDRRRRRSGRLPVEPPHVVGEQRRPVIRSRPELVAQPRGRRRRPRR